MENKPQVTQLHAMLFTGAIAIVATTILQLVVGPMHGGSFFLSCGLLFFPSLIATAYWLRPLSASSANKPVQFIVFAGAIWGLALHIEVSLTDKAEYQRAEKRRESERYGRESKLENELSRLSPGSRSTVEDLLRENSLQREREKSKN
ncbi:hypothetical protein [Prosthecobacter sp.]|uniref:hypothetical protein n=1 Tax=Prosthecobacter sp. TaxID=1965333 RepID=UPI00248A89DE|nr:hypothetical protein [Prosthecobacter sp.]MDI1314022.1 hypothetical protein [Prosthecobacter sp.]